MNLLKGEKVGKVKIKIKRKELELVRPEMSYVETTRKYLFKAGRKTGVGDLVTGDEVILDDGKVYIVAEGDICRSAKYRPQFCYIQKEDPNYGRYLY